MNKQIILLLLTGCFFFGCEDDSMLESSIYVEDAENPGLPQYSELGYNTFGAYYDRQSFTYSSIIPLKVIETEDETSFAFSGRMGNHEMALTVQLRNFFPEDYTDLLELHDTNLDLEDNDFTVIIEEDGVEQEAEILNGTFHFKRAQNLYVNGDLYGVVLSGTFEFQALVDSDPITVSKGRFDVTVNEDNFYVID